MSFEYLIQDNNPRNNFTMNNDLSFVYDNSLSFTDGLPSHFLDALSLAANKKLFLLAAAGDGHGSWASVTSIPAPKSYAML